MGCGLKQNVVANFGDDLKFSADLSDEPAWLDYYKRLFPNLQAAVQINRDCPMQRHGVDRILHLGNGQTITVDEKKRRKTWVDVLIEYWSNYERKTIGWTFDRDKVCDYIAYAIPKRQRCYFMPFPILRLAAYARGKEWSDKYKWSKAPNRGYTTWNVGVPWPVVSAELIRQMERGYAGDLVLPPLAVKESHSDQLTLEFRTPADQEVGTIPHIDKEPPTC